MMRFSDYLRKHEYMYEAQFKEDNLHKVSSLYGRLFGKYFGGEFKVLYTERFSRTTGEKGLGIRLMNGNGYQLRLNFSNKNTKVMSQSFSRESMVLDSMDYWDNSNLDFEQPTLTVNFNKSTNVVQIWNNVAKLIRSGKTGQFSLNGGVNEARKRNNPIPKDIQLNFINKYGLGKYLVSKTPQDFAVILSQKGLYDDYVKYLNANGITPPEVDLSNIPAPKVRGRFKQTVMSNDDITVNDTTPDANANSQQVSVTITRGKKEVNETGKRLRQADKEFDNQVYADPDLVFEDIENMTTAIAKGAIKSLIICGMGGIGKTYHVEHTLTQTLGPKNQKWMYHSGAKISPRSFFSTLFLERKHTVVWDEADSLLKNDEIIMMLKPLLDTSGENTCEYKTGTLNNPQWSRAQWEDYANECDNLAYHGGSLVFTAKPAQLLKDHEAAMDDSDDGEGKKKKRRNEEAENMLPYPSKFYFTGNMIFISNMRADDIEDAVKSRSLFIDVYLCATDVQKRLLTIAMNKFGKERAMKLYESIAGSLPDSSSGPKVTYMTPEFARKTKPITVRSLVIANALEEAGIPNWERLASLYA